MKKMLNNVDNAVDEMIDGFIRSRPNHVKRWAGNPRVVVRHTPKAPGKVGLVIGNGSGHEPIAVGWVGEGMLDANAVGDIFAAPPPELVCDAIRAADGGAGVLLLISNHAGDVMNGEAGADLAREAGSEVETLWMYDDISTGPRDQLDRRRGGPGTTFIYKIVGARAEQGAGLQELKALGESVRDVTCTLAASLTPGVSPLTGLPMFTLPENEVFVGMGVHGEPGMASLPAGSADEIVDFMAGKILDDLPFRQGDQVLAMVNGMGGTTLMELFIVFRKFAQCLDERGVQLAADPLVGTYVTTQEMGGFSLSLCKADQTMVSLWNQPQNAPFFQL
ncbi:MAG: dihydroxyacetone kinase subunit DhaK [Pseudomonadota bacterium]